MKPLSIGQVARRTGLRASALRYYEKAGVLPAPARVSGQRRYDAGVLRRIEALRFAQQAGFTLEEIKTLFGELDAAPLSTRWQSMVRAKLHELDLAALRIQKMRQALELGLACGCVRIEDCTLLPADGLDTSGKRTTMRRTDRL
jgi:MerR family redox-sensitive transcriptional activator SoxR